MFVIIQLKLTFLFIYQIKTQIIYILIYLYFCQTWYPKVRIHISDS
jgi:hypothetical protein